MGQTRGSKRARLTDFLHRLNAQGLYARGREIELCRDHPGVVRKTTAQKASVETFPNPLATAFYEEPIGVEAALASAELWELENVWVVGEDGVVFFDPDRALGVCHHVQAKFPKKARRPIRRFSRRIEEPVFVLRGRSSENRAHFLVEHLPRLVMAQAILEFGFKVLVMSGQASWQRPYLEKLGVADSSIIEASNGTTYCRKAYYLPLLSPTNRSVLGPSRIYREIARAFREGAEAPREDGVLFLSRSDAAFRVLRNEEDVVRVLEEFYGPVRVARTSEYDLDEQIALVAGATRIVAPHGQALRNVLFSEGATVMQLCPGLRAVTPRRWAWEEAYSALALMGGNRSINLYSGRPEIENSDWSFPLDRLRGALGRLRNLENGELIVD